MALIDRIESLLPRALARLEQWAQLGAACALVIDALIDGAIDGAKAAMPGQLDELPLLGGFLSVDALPLIGRDRRIPRGLAEAPAPYAARLRAWRRTHRLAGTGFGILEMIRGALAPSPTRVRLVTGAGLWYTIEADGTRKLHTPDGTGFQITPAGVSSALTAAAHPWDWDGSGNPFELFLIVYAPVPEVIPADEGDYGDGTTLYGDGGLIGVDSTPALRDQLRGLLAEFATQGVKVNWMIVAFDNASFDPETAGPYPAAGMPDGQWGVSWKLDGGVMVKSRLETARYARGPAY